MGEYPEHEKMAAMRAGLDAVASFLEHLEAGRAGLPGLRGTTQQRGHR